MVQEIKDAISAVEAIHVLALLLIAFTIAYMVRPADTFLGNSAHDLLLAVLVATRIGGPNQPKG